MRSLLAAAVLASIAAPAMAQTSVWTSDPMARIRDQNAALNSQQADRQRALADQRAAFAASQRARTQSLIQSIEAQRQVNIAPAPAVLPAPLDTQMSAAADAIARRQNEELAASNARILAIKPASEE